MGINFTAVKKVLKSAESVWVQYSDNGAFVEVCDGHFIARMTEKQYEDEGFVKALGTGLPSDKAICLTRKSKKGKWEVIKDRLKTGALTKIAEDVQTATATRVYYENEYGKMMSIYKLANGEAVFLATDLADIIKGCFNLVGSKKYGPICYIEDGEVMAMVLPVKAEIEVVHKALDFTPKNEKAEPIKVKEVVEDEPLSAPTYDEVEETEDEPTEEVEEVADETDEVDDIDELDSPEEIEKSIVKDSEEEPPTVIDGWTVPSDIFIEVTPNGTMWAIGKTKPERENLKRLGFHYAPKAERAKKAGYPRSAWYRKARLAEVAAD